MHVFANTDTRIINYQGTIIIISSFNPGFAQYRVFIDGVASGFLQEMEGILHPAPGTEIKPVFLQQINKLIKCGAETLTKKTG